MRSLAFKLTLAFLFVGVVGAVLVGLFVNFQTRRQFNQFLTNSFEATLVEQLQLYYAETDTWDGVGRVLMQAYQPGNRPIERPFESPWMVVDGKGQVVMGGGHNRPGEQIDPRQVAEGTLLVVDGEPVGWLVRVPFNSFRSPNPSPEEQFLDRVTEGVLLSLAAAAVVALLVGILLARTITNPIKELTVATTAVAGGELGRQVTVRSQDEIGALATSFNQMSTDLSHASQQRRQMTADIAHELRTPLSIILGYTESLRDGILPPDTETFEILHDEAEHLSRLVQDLRTLSLAEAGKLTLHPEAMSPVELLSLVIGKYRYQAEQKNITLNLSTAENLPEIEVDQGRMEQVLGNLVSNALRFTPTFGEIRLTAVQPDSNHIQLAVQDNGAGIPEDVLPKVFDRFYKADESRQAHEGESGLGLAIARSIVLMHGGTISVESKAGEGTKFTITLPLKKIKD